MTTINNIKSTLKVLFFVFLLIGATSNTYSQYQNATAPSQVDNQVEDNMEEVESLPDDPDPLNVPFDGGASILIAAGAAYGAKKYREKHLKK